MPPAEGSPLAAAAAAVARASLTRKSSRDGRQATPLKPLGLTRHSFTAPVAEPYSLCLDILTNYMVVFRSNTALLFDNSSCRCSSPQLSPDTNSSYTSQRNFSVWQCF